MITEQEQAYILGMMLKHKSILKDAEIALNNNEISLTLNDTNK